MSAFPLLGTQLRSITETVRICPGFGDHDCGDELDPDKDLCKACQREEDDFYHRQMCEKEGIELPVYYEHLTDRE